MTWDTYARLKTATDGRGIVTTYAYDKLDRLLAIDYSGPTPTVVYTYHPAGTTATRVDGAGTVTYGYDGLDRLTSRTATTGGGTISYGYDKAGNVTAGTDAGGTISYSYDTAYQLTSQTVTGGDTVGYAYNTDGKRTDTWFATNTAHTTFAAHSKTAYDKAKRVSRSWTSRASNDATRVFDTSYCYAPFVSGQPCPTTTTADTGLIQWSVDNLTGARSIYSYDGANRLTGVTDFAGHDYSYGYDSRGNRTSEAVDGTTTQTRTFNAGNQITSTGYSYDQAGNRTHDPIVETLTYNGAGQMTAKTGAANADYTYAGPNQNELVHKNASGASTFDYAYGRTDANGLPLLETLVKNGATYQFDYDQTGTPTSLRVPSGNRNFFALDGHGSVVGLIKQDGTVSGTYTYDPYGDPLTATGTGEAVGVNVHRYALGFADSDTDWTKHGTRWNDTTTGTWTTQDPLIRLLDPDNGNRYNYAASNPINYLDPPVGSVRRTV